MSEAIGPYELRGELGRGAMAVVWRAFDTKLEREVAVKEPTMPAGSDSAIAAEFSARFVREGKAAAGLNHPGIVTIYAADIYDDRAAIIMELIEGDTLATILDGGPLEAASALAVLDQLLDAIGYAHSKGVVHRDVKPDNVFITSDGRVKLADFGIAQVGTGATLTQAGTVMGTPGYMAPEQVVGEHIDARADIFAIGVIGYEMLSGRNPFGSTDGLAPTTVMYRIVHEAAPTLPSDAFAHLPADLGIVLQTAMAKDPDDRFIDAAAFRAALTGAPIVTARHGDAVGDGVSTGSGTEVAGPGKQNWTPYMVVGAAGVLVILGMLMSAGGGTGTVQPVDAQSLAAQAASQSASAPAPAPAASDYDSSKAILNASYKRIVKLGKPKTGTIGKLARRFTNEAGRGHVSATTMGDLDEMIADIGAMSADLAAADIDPSLKGTRKTQVKLLTLCDKRVQAMIDSGEMRNNGDSGWKGPLNSGHDARVSFESLYYDGKP